MCYDEHKYRILRKHIDNTYKLADGKISAAASAALTVILLQI